MVALSVDNVSKAYDGNPALADVSFAVESGRVLALCGENGAGKSTLIKILAGATPPDAGSISLDGKAVAIRDPRHAIELGIRTVYQELSLLPHLSVAENILLGKMPHRGANWVVDWPQANETATRELANFGFDRIDPRSLVAELSVSEQQVVEIAKALVGRPRILILDEPTSVLSARETETLFAKIRELTASGVIVLYVSHRLEEIFEISDEVLVLKDGVNVLAAKTREIDRNGLISAMVGRSLAAIYPNRVTRPGPAVLECRGLCRAGVFEDVSLAVHAGEIVGMFGLVGSGRTDVARALFGATPATSGEILVDGAPVEDEAPGGRDRQRRRLRHRRSQARRPGARPQRPRQRRTGLDGPRFLARRAQPQAASDDRRGEARRACSSSARRQPHRAPTQRRQPAEGRARQVASARTTRAFSSSTNRRAGSTSPRRSRSTASWRTSPLRGWRSC